MITAHEASALTKHAIQKNKRITSSTSEELEAIMHVEQTDIKHAVYWPVMEPVYNQIRFHSKKGSNCCSIPVIEFFDPRVSLLSRTFTKSFNSLVFLWASKRITREGFYPTVYLDGNATSIAPISISKLKESYPHNSAVTLIEKIVETCSHLGYDPKLSVKPNCDPDGILTELTIDLVWPIDEELL